jgi:hypothetical protein
VDKTAVAGLGMPLVELAMAYQRSRVVCAAARLGIADSLAAGERSVDELAVACSADASSLHRLLRALCCVGLVAETQPGRFVLTNAGQPLRRDAPHSAWPAVVFWADLLADNWSSLTECVRTGQTAAMLRPEIVTRWRDDPEASAIFRAVMGTSGSADYLPIARAWDFSRARVVADLGGGGGALLEAILVAYPGVRGMLVDRESSVEAARPRFASPSLVDRAELVTCDLTEAVPAGADVYILKHVLHGYADDAAADILRHCRGVVPSGGRMLIVEFVLPEVIDRPDPAIEARIMSDLNMLAVTGGKERTSSEWRRLLGRPGLRCEGIFPVPGDLVSIIEASCESERSSALSA